MDNDAGTEHIKALMGERVTVTNPDNPEGTWTGILVGRYDEPVVILGLLDGRDRVLPQSFTITEAAPGEPRSEDEILAAYAGELPEFTVEAHGVPCVNCQACAALADMRAALRCVLLPWLEARDDPAAARRLRASLETSLDEIEDQIDAASGLDR